MATEAFLTDLVATGAFLTGLVATRAFFTGLVAIRAFLTRHLNSSCRSPSNKVQLSQRRPQEQLIPIIKVTWYAINTSNVKLYILVHPTVKIPNKQAHSV